MTLIIKLEKHLALLVFHQTLMYIRSTERGLLKILDSSEKLPEFDYF